jgi:hypothetical protein
MSRVDDADAFVVVVVVAAIVIAAVVGVAVANANANVDDACSDVNALPTALDVVAYVDDDNDNADRCNNVKCSSPSC